MKLIFFYYFRIDIKKTIQIMHKNASAKPTRKTPLNNFLGCIEKVQHSVYFISLRYPVFTSYLSLSFYPKLAIPVYEYIF